jgi:hypothetical protein
MLGPAPQFVGRSDTIEQFGVARSDPLIPTLV